jgi:hypothetical protein
MLGAARADGPRRELQADNGFGMSATAFPSACPQCGQLDQVQRVAGIVASQRSQLSWELHAPPPPGAAVRRRQPGGMPGWVWGLLVLVLLTLPLDVLLLTAAALLLAVFAVAIAAVLVVAGAAYGTYRYLNRHVIAERRAAARRRHEDAARRYQHAVVYWSQFEYCHRCHGIFLPGHPWQHPEITRQGALVAPAYAWSLAQQLADHAERANAPEVLRLGGD